MIKNAACLARADRFVAASISTVALFRCRRDVAMVFAAKGLMRFAFAAAIGAAVLVSAPLASAQQTDPAAVESIPATAIAPGEVIVKLRPGTSEQSRDAVLAAVDGIFVRDLDLSDLILARVPVGSEISAAESLQVDTNVVYAEPNWLQASTQ